MCGSVYDLSYLYIQRKYRNFDIPLNIKINVIKSVKECLVNGRTYNEINKAIKESKDFCIEDDKFFRNIRSGSFTNLLKHDRGYIHNELIITNPAPKKMYDFNTGEIVMCGEENDFYLEYRASYTIEDMYNYIKKQSAFYDVIDNFDRSIGTIKYLCSKYDVEHVLFMIDAIQKEYDATLIGKVKSLIKINEYSVLARENYNIKRTILISSGFTKEIPRKRTT